MLDIIYIVDVICRIEYDCLELKVIIFNKELWKIVLCDKLDDD